MVKASTNIYKALIGTGGIGSGSLFLLNGNHTLGREESRGGKFLDARDYCKLHIITHNFKTLMEPDFPVFPIGKIGDDDVGRVLFHEMEQVGLETPYVQYSHGKTTLFGFSFLYPDGTGGNLTTEESASSKVDASFIENARPVFRRYAGNLISLAVPEVPLESRKKLLELSKEHVGFSVASFTSNEVAVAEKDSLLELVDLLAMNKDETAAFVHADIGQSSPKSIVEKAIEKIKKIRPSAWMSITFGKEGSWSWDGTDLSFVPAFPVATISSAGSGDAHLAGIMAGLSAGLTLKQAQILGTVTAAFSVTSAHTIHPDMNRKIVSKLAVTFKNKMDPVVLGFLSG
jgi:sugar/nucleoside kinase (ribokinase family)